MKTKTAMLGVCLTAALSIASTCGYAESFKVSETVSGGVLNIRTGPGANYALVGAATAGTQFNWNGKATCMARQDGIRGADWCRVNYNGVVGWVSRAGLMPVPYSASSEPPRYSTEPVDNSLVCERPDVLIGSDLVSDPNPVIRVEVSYAPDTHNWQVFHYFAKGGAVSRAEQYAIRDLSDSKRTLWTGNYYRNRAKVMFGEVKAGSGEAYYVEFDLRRQEAGDAVSRQVPLGRRRCSRAANAADAAIRTPATIQRRLTANPNTS